VSSSPPTKTHYKCPDGLGRQITVSTTTTNTFTKKAFKTYLVSFDTHLKKEMASNQQSYKAGETRGKAQVIRIYFCVCVYV